MRILVYVGCIAGVAIAGFKMFWPPQVVAANPSAPRAEWIDVERPFPAFALAIPEAVDAPANYAIKRHSEGGGRKDILSLGEPNGVSPYLRVEIYRPGNENEKFDTAIDEISMRASDLGIAEDVHAQEPVDSKFGPLDLVKFTTKGESRRNCLGFARAFDDPRLQISGWFCQGGENFVSQATLSCAIDRLTLLAAGSDPKVGALFAQAELARKFCGQRSPLLAATPKYRTLWTALEQRNRRAR